ncbi:hypothetical protein [Delftia acidovorans]|uniref:Uncharacterized protein n=1 Tax=Delftia acidovorans TaxID=80866 RepID=A0AAJ2R6P0_DELAC|nr:hypothetical protein [Delftia acidovorans]MDX4958118.1 hypothetical protein [Delftia acidovorans]
MRNSIISLSFPLCIFSSSVIAADQTVFWATFNEPLSTRMSGESGSANSPGKVVIDTWGLGVLNKKPNWEVGEFTGMFLTPAEKSTAELAVNTDWVGSSAVQGSGNNFALQLHTWSSGSSNYRFNTKAIFYRWTAPNQISPWNTSYYPNGTQLCTGIFAAVPGSYTGDGSANYGGVDLKFVDTYSGQSLVVSGHYYHSLGIGEDANHDTLTGWSQIISHFGSQNYIKSSLGSSTGKTMPWSNFEWFGYCVGRPEIDKAINAIKARFTDKSIDLQADRLRFDFALAGSEIYTGPNDIHNGWMAVKFKDWTVYTKTP